MVMASWPAVSRRAGRAPLPASVRRHVEQALRLDIRHALRVGGPLVAVAVLADAVHLVLRFGDPAWPAAGLEVAVAAAALLLTRVARRWARKPQPAALAVMAMLFAATLVNLQILPQAAATGIAYLAVVLTISAVFLTWSPRWHSVWLGSAILMSLVPLVAGARDPDALSTAVAGVVTTVIAGLASLVAHRIAYARMVRVLEHQFSLRALSRRAREQEGALAELNHELMRTARLDTVTGIGNRRALDEALAALAGRRLAAVLLDVDHFKAYNDRNGHLAGDAALAQVGSILRTMVRGNDLVFRYGGEEFLILLPGAESHGALVLAERVRSAIQDETAAELGLTVSAGVASSDRFSSSSPLPLLRRADAALYRAKRTGRNRVVVDEPAQIAGVALAG